MRSIAVVGRKGGSGKTTVAVHLALGAHLAGRAAMVVDTDPQRSAVEVLSARAEPGPDWLYAPPQDLLKTQRDARAAGVQALFIDTPAATEETLSTALVLSDLALLVIRPTFLDLAAAVQTAEVVRRLRKPALVVLNQAPAAREGVEPPAVRKAREALRLMRLPVVPTILRSRASYQTTLATGRSAVELATRDAGAAELDALWGFVERFVFGASVDPGMIAA